MADEQSKGDPQQANTGAMRVWSALQDLAERKVAARDDDWRELANALRALAGAPELEPAGGAVAGSPVTVGGPSVAFASRADIVGISRPARPALIGAPVARTTGAGGNPNAKTTGPVVTTIGPPTPRAPAPPPAPPPKPAAPAKATSIRGGETEPTKR